MAATRQTLSRVEPRSSIGRPERVPSALRAALPTACPRRRPVSSKPTERDPELIGHAAWTSIPTNPTEGDQLDRSSTGNSVQRPSSHTRWYDRDRRRSRRGADPTPRPSRLGWPRQLSTAVEYPAPTRGRTQRQRPPGRRSIRWPRDQGADLKPGMRRSGRATPSVLRSRRRGRKTGVTVQRYQRPQRRYSVHRRPRYELVIRKH